jgi:hypothetical protein
MSRHGQSALVASDDLSQLGCGGAWVRNGSNAGPRMRDRYTLTARPEGDTRACPEAADGEY